MEGDAVGVFVFAVGWEGKVGGCGGRLAGEAAVVLWGCVSVPTVLQWYLRMA